MADALDSGSSGGNTVRVQVPFSAWFDKVKESLIFKGSFSFISSLSTITGDYNSYATCLLDRLSLLFCKKLSTWIFILQMLCICYLFIFLYTIVYIRPIFETNPLNSGTVKSNSECLTGYIIPLFINCALVGEIVFTFFLIALLYLKSYTAVHRILPLRI